MKYKLDILAMVSKYVTAFIFYIELAYFESSSLNLKTYINITWFDINSTLIFIL